MAGTVFPGKLKASEYKELADIPIAEFASHSTEQNLKEDIYWDFNKVERSVRSLIIGPAIRLAAKHGLSQVSSLLKIRGAGTVAMRAIHRR